MSQERPVTDQEQREAYEAGKQAFKDGKPQSVGLALQVSRLRFKWLQGWSDAKNKRL